MVTRRYGRFALEDGDIHYARVEPDGLHLLAAPPWRGERGVGRIAPGASARRLCPVEPSKILAIGRNYAAHAKEMKQAVPATPLVFLKAPSSLLDPEGVVFLPPESRRVDHEAELGIVVGRRGRRIPVERSMEHIFGYTIVGDITARDLQQSDGQWSRAKGFDTFCPVGPEIVTGIDPSTLSVRGSVNGQIRQEGNTRDMIFSVAQLVSHLSQAMTLEPGDLIATGTPEGVGPLVDGDVFEIEIESIGTLRVCVQNERRDGNAIA